MYLVLDFERGHQEMLGQDFDRYRDEEKKLKMFEEKFQTTNAMTDAVFSIDRNRFYFLHPDRRLPTFRFLMMF
jgi:hypothetical protein